jgi:hypothetical protein
MNVRAAELDGYYMSESELLEDRRGLFACAGYRHKIEGCGLSYRRINAMSCCLIAGSSVACS